MIGLVLEGGAMRGMYTAGVLDIFLNNNIKADKIIGVSAGVLFGVMKRIERDSRKLQEMYDLGVQDCKNRLSDLKNYLRK